MATRKLAGLMPVILALLLAGSHAFSQDPINVGDTTEQVIAVLGKPKGKMNAGNVEFLVYDRGRVTIVEGKVWAFTLMSEEKAAQKMARLHSENVADETMRSRNIEAGLAEKADKLADPAFTGLPPADRLTYWRQFAARYPEISVVVEIAGCENQMKQSGPRSLSTDERAGIEARIAQIEKEIAEQDELLTAPDRTATKAERRAAQREIRALELELSVLRSKLK